MRIVFFIDSLASGGAQRQLVELAKGLKGRGNDIFVICYERLLFFADELEDADIEVIPITQRNKFENIRNFRRTAREIKPDIIQAYLHGPGVIAELGSFFGKRWKLITTERSIYNQKFQNKTTFVIGRQLHRLADWIVVNSHSNMELLKSRAPFLRKKISVILNSVDLERFRPAGRRTQSDRERLFEFVHVGSMSPIKNAPNIVRALALLHRKSTRRFRLRWIGRAEEKSANHMTTLVETQQLVRESDLQDSFEFLGEKHDVENYLAASDALILCSKFEGLPNAVCEGMAAGLPIVASRVSDNEMLVRDGVNGFLCDPFDVEDIAAALKACLELPDEDYIRYGRASRQMAREMFNRERYVSEYEELYKKLLG